MQEEKYMDLLLVKPVNGGLGRMVLCAAHEAHPGNLVRFGANEIGTVEQVAWAGENDGDMVRLLREAGAVSDAVEVFCKSWESEMKPM